MTTFRKDKEVITQKMLQAVTFADTERYEVDESRLTAQEIIDMKEFLNKRGYF